jgi:hypothetical protein
MRRATYEAVSLEAVLFEGGWFSPSDEDVLGRFVVASFRRTFRLVPTNHAVQELQRCCLFSCAFRGSGRYYCYLA